MAEVRLFYQERADGGQRSGLYVDRDSVLGMFTPGGDEPDPSLLWYVDLVWETGDPPFDGPAARRWLRDHSEDAASAIAAAAGELGAGIDVGITPWRLRHETGRGPVLVSVSAMRRFAATDISRKLEGLASRWAALSPELESVS